MSAANETVVYVKPLRCLLGLVHYTRDSLDSFYDRHFMAENIWILDELFICHYYTLAHDHANQSALYISMLNYC